MTRAAKNTHRKLAWCLIMGAVGLCTFLPTVAATLLVSGVLYAVTVEFLS